MLDNEETISLSKIRKKCIVCLKEFSHKSFAVNKAYPKGEDVCKYCRSTIAATPKGVVRALRTRGNKIIKLGRTAVGYAYLNAADYVECKLVELSDRRKSK